MVLGIILFVFVSIYFSLHIVFIVFSITIPAEILSLFVGFSLLGFYPAVASICLNGAKIAADRKAVKNYVGLIFSIFALILFISYIIFRYALRAQAQGFVFF